MLPGSFCLSASLAYLYEKLQGDYCILLPEYNGHYAGSAFTTRRGEAAEVAAYLQAHSMQRVCLLYGQSMGAEVGIELYRQLLDNGVAVDHCLFDGAPCISLPGFYKKFMYCIFKRILDKVRGKSVNDVLEMPQSDRGARRVSGWHGAIVSEGLQPYGVDRFTTQTGRSLSQPR